MTPDIEPAEKVSNKSWYRKWWGIILALLFWPVFVIWYAWFKAKWNIVLKISASVVALFFGSAFAAGAMKPTQPTNNTPPKAFEVKNTSKPSPTPTPIKASQTPSSTPTPKATPSPSAKPLSTLDKAWIAVDNSLKTRKGIDISYDSDTKVIFISHTDLSPYSAESFVRQTFTILVLYGKEAFNIDGVDSVNVQNITNFTDQYGKVSPSSGVIIDMQKAEYAKFDWKNLEYQEVDTRIQDASDVYIIKPAINSQITDRSKLYLKLQY